MKKLLIIIALLFIPQSVGAAAYYIDYVNGNDANTGLSTTTSWLSINKFTEEARNAGDIAFVRRGMATTTGLTTINFLSDGNLNNPIVLTADYDNLWSDFASSTVTWTPTFGSKYIASSASSTDFTVENNWIYIQGDCYERGYDTWSTGSTTPLCEFAYEVASTSPDGLSLYLPYKGNQSGSGKNMRVMPPAPVWGTLTNTVGFSMTGDHYWVMKGLDIRSTNSSCNIILSANKGTILYDMIFLSDTSTNCSISSADAGTYVKKNRHFSNFSQLNPKGAIIEDNLIDCQSVGGASAFVSVSYGVLTIKDSEISRCINDLNPNLSTGGFFLYATNLIRKGVYAGGGLGGLALARMYFEDDFGTVGLNTQTSNQISASTVATTTRSDTANLRSGGAPKSHLIFPPSGTGDTGISTNYFPFSYMKLFEYPIYTDTSSKTYTAYFMATSTTAFTVLPLTATREGSSTPELYIECEYYNQTSGANRIIKKSNTANAFTDDGTWYGISVTCQPTQAGLLYLRGWYGKPKDAEASNWFFVDPQIEIQ